MKQSSTIAITSGVSPKSRHGVTNPLGIRVDDLLPPFERWRLRPEEPDEPANLPVPVAGEACLFASPCFKVQRDVHYAFEMTFTVAGPGGAMVGFRDKWNRWCQLFENPKGVVGEGAFRIVVPLRVAHDTKVSLCVVSRQPIGDLQISVYARRRQPSPADATDTCLPHWNVRQRMLHRLCRRSRLLNTIVASYEMRRGHEEVISVPQYMSLCPTGQCNALCAFCSVTINRTGIAKRQLPFAKVRHWLAPVMQTVRMFGLEGNGEPTLFTEFGPLVTALSEHGASSYLITNASRLTQEHVDLLVASPVPSVNVSLNAATAATHERVMKLKEFDGVVAGIRRLIATRGANGWPSVSLSFVVDADNVHEVQDFLWFAEHELQADFIVVRPLSELGDDLGTVEDVRDIVPYESDIRDMIDSVREYMADVPRRRLYENDRVRSWITFDPQSFHSVRPDPAGRVVHPRGCEQRLLAPRRDSWHGMDATLDVRWRLNTVTLSARPAQAGVIWKSDAVPVEPESTLLFRAHVELEEGPIAVAVSAMDGREIVREDVQPCGRRQTIELVVPTGATRAVTLSVVASGAFRASIDFERVRTPGPIVETAFVVPDPRRWTIDTAGTVVQWTGSRQTIRYDGAPGPYLVKTYSVACPAHATIELPVGVDVSAGTLMLGVLNQDFSRFIAQTPIGPGDTEAMLCFDTGDNARVQVVVSAGETPLVATIDWRDHLGAARAWEGGEPDTIEVTADAPATPASTPPRVRFFCQKPWTDLNSFTVDGRMDVCCIATGPSQQRFALGNMFEQNFQEIWNGERAREFRRTVNDPDPQHQLPPCRRCPLAYQYQGPFFDPVRTPELASREIVELIPPVLLGRFDRAAEKRLTRVLHWVNERFLSDGFKV